MSPHQQLPAHARTATHDSPRLRIRAAAVAALTALALTLSATAAGAAGLSGGAIDNHAAAKPGHLGGKCAVPSGAKSGKVILVKGTGGAKASVKACEKWNGAYYSALSVSGYVGYNGIAAAGKKREGDGKTPSGVYAMGFGFGVKAKPKEFTGAKYVRMTKDHVWVDGKATKKYNTLQRKSQGYKGESMYQRPAYDYGQVIGYNTAGTPGKGSAIFLHVNTGTGKTAGCVSVSQANLLKIFKWEGRSSVQIAIVR